MMSLPLLLDENLRDEGLWQAIQTRNASAPIPLDVIRVGDESAPPCHTGDPEIIRWAEAHGRLLVSLDKSTLPRHLRGHLAAGRTSPGILLLKSGLPLPDTVELLFLIALVTEPTEWANACRWIP